MSCQRDLDTSRALSVVHVAQQWQKVGGSAATTVVAVAVAMAESGLDPFATSETCARGLWQIEDDSFIEGRPTADELFDSYNNAFWAHSLSNGGTYWSPWDSCYATYAGAVARRPISYPEVGSNAYKNIAIVARQLGEATNLAGMQGAWEGRYQNVRSVSMVRNIRSD